MVMTKKLLITITILLMLIISMFGAVCYADYDTTQFLYDSNNKNVLNKTVINDNQNTNINNLYTSGYRSIISRYSNSLIHVKYELGSVRYEIVWYCTGSIVQSEISNYIDNNINHTIVANLGNNSLEIQNLDTTHLNISNYYSGNEYSVILTGYIEFDMPLTNTQLLRSSNASELFFSNIGIYFTNTRFTSNGKTYYVGGFYLASSNQFNYTVTYTMPYKLNNVDGVYFFNEMNVYSTSSDFNNNFAISGSFNVNFNNTNNSLSGTNGVFSRQSLLVNMDDNSELTQFGYKVSYTSSWNFSQYTFNTNEDLFITISTFTPLFYNDNQYFIQADTNGSITPLKLDYYDAKWYELHYQLANAFIFLITELPIISNITNAVYSTINVIQTAFNTLSEFSAFGYIFAFGMFALVFGILIKLLIGD